jgi:hypothetical protein
MTPTRTHYREVLAQVAARAKERLPQAVNGRVESAVKLVLAGDVLPQDDGSILVGSSSDPMKTYLLVGTTCECQDFQHDKAPEGWCQHRIAAGIAKRVQEVLAAQTPDPVPEPAAEATVAATVAPDAASPAVPAVPLGEAPASVNCHIMLGGRQVQLTLRDTDEQRLLARLAAVLQHYPTVPAPQAPQQRPASGETSDKGWCAIHQCAMKLNEKDGRTWYSHRTDDGFCKGRRR